MHGAFYTGGTAPIPLESGVIAATSTESKLRSVKDQGTGNAAQTTVARTAQTLTREHEMEELQKDPLFVKSAELLGMMTFNYERAQKRAAEEFERDGQPWYETNLEQKKPMLATCEENIAQALKSPVQVVKVAKAVTDCSSTHINICFVTLGIEDVGCEAMQLKVLKLYWK